MCLFYSRSVLRGVVVYNVATGVCARQNIIYIVRYRTKSVYLPVAKQRRAIVAVAWSPWRETPRINNTLARNCCKAHAKINRNIENSTPCKIVSHERFNLKIRTRDYAVDVTRHATFGRIGPVGAFPQ